MEEEAGPKAGLRLGTTRGLRAPQFLSVTGTAHWTVGFRTQSDSLTPGNVPANHWLPRKEGQKGQSGSVGRRVWRRWYGASEFMPQPDTWLIRDWSLQS